MSRRRVDTMHVLDRAENDTVRRRNVEHITDGIKWLLHLEGSGTGLVARPREATPGRSLGGLLAKLDHEIEIERVCNASQGLNSMSLVVG